jgi:hypothetical protein
MVSVLAAGTAWAATGILEVPDSNESGISLIAGWHCSAKVIEIQVDDGPLIKAGVGTWRPDTASVCGRSDTGFGITYNYNVHKPGLHTVSAYADGVLFAKRFTFTDHFGVEYLTGANGGCAVTDFPVRGKQAILSWSEAKQNFSITSVAPTSGTALYPLGKWSGAARTSVVENGCVGIELPMLPAGYSESTATAAISLDRALSSMTVDLSTNGRRCVLAGELTGHEMQWSFAADPAKSDFSCLAAAPWNQVYVSTREMAFFGPSVGNERVMALMVLARAPGADGKCPTQWISLHASIEPR